MIEETFEDVCDDGCCALVIDPELRPQEGDPSVYWVRPMYQVIRGHNDEYCLSCWACERNTEGGTLMVVRPEDYDEPGVIFL